MSPAQPSMKGRKPGDRPARKPNAAALAPRSRKGRARARATGSAIQRNLNGEVHGWYRTVLGYPDRLVSELIEEFGIVPGDMVLDPFCGSGTTLVECKKRGIDSVGIDASPSSCFASRAKINWRVSPKRFRELATQAEATAMRLLQRRTRIDLDPTYRYLEDSGMLKRKWISGKPLRKAIALKRAIEGLGTSGSYRNLLKLALISEVVHGSSNVRFGPELYLGAIKTDAKLFEGFRARASAIAADLEKVASLPAGHALARRGDSRVVATFAGALRKSSVAAVISSPPYPAEHDYTRNARLELAFLEAVPNRDALRAIKKAMVRSHTKGIYAGDSEASLVKSNRQIDNLARKLERKVKSKTHGFARLYPTVLREYFGGMKRHLDSVKPFLARGALCAYVVGDQSSYLRVRIPTAKILAQLASDAGFEVLGVRRWRRRWSTTTSSPIDENILVLRKPQRCRK